MLANNDDFDHFASCFNAGSRQLVHRILVADTQTPVSAYLKLAGDSLPKLNTAFDPKEFDSIQSFIFKKL